MIVGALTLSWDDNDECCFCLGGLFDEGDLSCVVAVFLRPELGAHFLDFVLPLSLAALSE